MAFNDDPQVKNCVKTFRGACFGIGLEPRNRGGQDWHVQFVTIVEDDGYWNISLSGKGSSYWLPELVDCYNRALTWVKEHCEVDKDGFGWQFPKCYR